MIAVLALGGAFGRGAYALHFKHHPPKPQKMHYKPDKNAYLFGGPYKAPKKQHLPKVSYHNSRPGKADHGKH